MTSVADKPILWKPFPGPQTEFLSRGEFEVFYGGTAGPGKTDALLMGGLRYIHEPRYKAIFLRRTYKQLQEVMDRAQELFPKVVQGARYSEDRKRWEFPSGASYKFGHMEHEPDWQQYKTDEYQYIAFDELTTFTERQYLGLFSRCRSSHGLPCYIRSGSHPGDIGHGWVKKRFINGAKPGVSRRFSFEIFGRKVSYDRVFIPGRVTDNPVLMRDPAYLARLAAMPEALRKAFLYGDWNISEGQYFDIWDQSRHVVRPFVIPVEWRRVITIDWGYTNPFCALWWAVSPEGHKYAYRELYLTQTDDEEQARLVSKLSFGETIEEIYADPSVWGEARGKNQWGVPTAEAWQKATGDWLAAKPADNRRIVGWQRCRAALKAAPDGKPQTTFFETCENAIRTIPELICSVTRPEDVDDQGEDHAADAWRYFEMSGEEPRRDEIVVETDFDPLASDQTDAEIFEEIAAGGYGRWN